MPLVFLMTCCIYMLTFCALGTSVFLSFISFLIQIIVCLLIPSTRGHDSHFPLLTSTCHIFAQRVVRTRNVLSGRVVEDGSLTAFKKCLVKYLNRMEIEGNRPPIDHILGN